LNQKDLVRATGEDFEVLNHNLFMLKQTCKDYDKKAAKGILGRLRQKTWSIQIDKLFAEMAEKLMSGDFEYVINASDRVVEMI